MSGKSNSLYIHVPFCTQKCDYCHFFVIPHQKRFVEIYLQALKKEIAFRPIPNELLTIYFGGGTPSLLPPETIYEILQLLPQAQEITIEVNPENTSFLKDFRQAGINRVSMGVQSFDDHLLTELSRRHAAQVAIDAVIKAKEAGFDNISIDLMYDIPKQTEKSWQVTLERAVKLPITHLSLYNLTIEPHTPFFKKKDKLSPFLPTEEESFRMLQKAVNFLNSNGLVRYEISAFAKEGFASLHNMGYWTGRPFLGLGPSAFSYWEGKRFKNVASLTKWAKALDEGVDPQDFIEELSPLAQEREGLAIGLRVLRGVDFPQKPPPHIEKLINDGFLVLQNKVLKLTERGQLFYDYVAEEIIEI